MNDNKIIDRLDNLKKLREEKNITQVKLSTDLEVSQELISRYELGSSFPQPQMLIKLANYFNCSIDYLLGVTDVRTPVKYLSLSSETIKNAEIINKYNSLSDTDKKFFERLLSCLLDKSQDTTLSLGIFILLINSIEVILLLYSSK